MPEETKRYLPIQYYGHKMIIYSLDGKEWGGCICGWRSRTNTNNVLKTWWEHALYTQMKANAQAS